MPRKYVPVFHIEDDRNKALCGAKTERFADQKQIDEGLNLCGTCWRILNIIWDEEEMRMA